MTELSIVIPVYNEAANLLPLYTSMQATFQALKLDEYEIIFVDDGSTDTSWKIIEKLSATDPHIKGLSFSRNFGHQYALRAGIDLAKGKAVVMMDADLQHPPELIPDFYGEWKAGHDIVYGIRQETEGISFSKKISSALFYGFLNKISDIRIEKGSSDFRLMDRAVVDKFKELNEYYLFLRGLVSWIGYSSKAVVYNAPKRLSGKSKYSFRKMIHLASDGIMSFSTRPLKLAMISGFILSLFAFAYIVYALLAKFLFHNALEGWTSLLISVLLIGGIQLLSLGIMGEYIGKIFMESKKRPHYIIRKKTW